MIRSEEPGRGSSMVILAPESPRILRMRAPPLPIMAPANCKQTNRCVNSCSGEKTGQTRSSCTYIFGNRNLSRFVMTAVVLTEKSLVVVQPTHQGQNKSKKKKKQHEPSIKQIEPLTSAQYSPGSASWLSDAHQRRRQFAVVASSPSAVAAVPGRRQRSGHITDQSWNLELPLGTTRTGIPRSPNGSTFAVAAILLSKGFVVVVRVVLFDRPFDLRLQHEKLTN